MSQPWTMLISGVLLLGMTLLNAHHSHLLRKSWRRERNAIDALDALTKAFENFRESHENLMNAHEGNAAALQKRIDILEGALRERGVNI